MADVVKCDQCELCRRTHLTAHPKSTAILRHVSREVGPADRDDTCPRPERTTSWRRASYEVRVGDRDNSSKDAYGAHQRRSGILAGQPRDDYCAG